MSEDARPAGSPDPSAPADAANPAFTTGYSNYVLGVLFLVYVMNFVDRQILSILLDPIKEDLGAICATMKKFLDEVVVPGPFEQPGGGVAPPEWPIGLLVGPAATETFTVALSNATNATLNVSTGTGTITDNEPVPTLSIDDVIVSEGVASADFTVSLSAASTLPVRSIPINA